MQITKNEIRQFTSWLGKRSYKSRLKRFGIERLREIARENGKLGGRPKKADQDGKGELMIYKRGDIYYYEFELRGRRYRESTRQGNPRVARQMEAARRTQILKGEVGIRERKPAMTLRKLADDCFKPHIECTFAAKFKTREYYLNSLKNLMAFHDIADKPLDEIKAEIHHSLRCQTAGSWNGNQHRQPRIDGTAADVPPGYRVGQNR